MAEKLEAEAEKLRAEGWKWVECVSELPREAHYMSRVHPKDIPLTNEQQAHLDRLEQEYAELEELIEAGVADDGAETEAEAIQAAITALADTGEGYNHRDPSSRSCPFSMPKALCLSIEKLRRRSSNEDRYPRPAAEAVRSFPMLLLGLHLGLRWQAEAKITPG